MLQFFQFFFAMLSGNSQGYQHAFLLFASDNSIFFYWVTKNYINYSNNDPNDNSRNSCMFPESVKIEIWYNEGRHEAVPKKVCKYSQYSCVLGPVSDWMN